MTSSRIADFILRHDKALLALVLSLTLILSAGLVWLRFSADNDNFFGRDNPEFQLIRQLNDTYTATSSVMVMLVPPEGQAFAPETLEAVRAIAEDAWFTPYVLRVESPTNYAHSYADGDDIFVEALLPDGEPITADLADRFARIAPEAEALKNRLIAGDGRAYGITIDIVLPHDQPGARVELRDWLRDKEAVWLETYPGFDIRMTGAVFGGLTLSQAAKDDVRALVPLSFVLAVGIFVFFLRSPLSVALGSTIVGLGTVATFGIAGWFGIELTAGTAISPLAVMVLTSASCVHFQLSWLRAQESMDAEAATRQALTNNLAPITVATLTTAIGFLGLNFADSPPLRDMGNIVALGLVMAMLLVFVLLPFGHRRGPKAPVTRTLPLSRARMQALAGFVWRTHLVWLAVFPVALLVAGVGIARIGFDDNLLRYFSERYEFRRDTDAIQDRLTGLDTLQFSFVAPEGGSVFDPDFLRDIDRFGTWLAAQDHVVAITGITDIVKRMNQSMSGDDPAAYRVADTREENAQLMMFYELSLPVGLDLNTQIDVDRTKTRIVAFLRVNHSEDIRALAARSEAWMAENTPQTLAQASGHSIAFARITERNNRQMLVGLVLVLVLVSMILMITMRNMRMGLISLVPNLVPAILAFGFWGVTFRDVNLGSTVVTTMTFGIVVDDTVHFLMHYLRRRREGLDPEEALRMTFSSVGAAILITSFALMAGFAIMATSGFAINQHMGALTACVICFALLADLLLLPAVLRLMEGTK